MAEEATEVPRRQRGFGTGAPPLQPRLLHGTIDNAVLHERVLEVAPLYLYFVCEPLLPWGRSGGARPLLSRTRRRPTTRPYLPGQAKSAVRMKACVMPVIAPLGKRQPVTCHGASPRARDAAAVKCVGPMSSTRLPLMIATMMI